MWSGTYPFSGMSEPQIYEKVGKKGLRPPLTSLKRYGRPIRDLIESMWHEVCVERDEMLHSVFHLPFH